MDDFDGQFRLLLGRKTLQQHCSTLQTNNRTNDKRRLFSPNCIIQGSSVTRMTSIGPAMVVSMGTDTVVHLRLSPTQNPVQNRGNSTDTLPLSLSLSKQVLLYDRPSSRKTALEARFPGTFIAIYSRPPILVAWNFPLTSMKLYDCFYTAH